MRRLFFFLLLGILMMCVDGNNKDRKNETKQRDRANQVGLYKAPGLSVTFAPNLWEDWDERWGAWRKTERNTYTPPT